MHMGTTLIVSRMALMMLSGNSMADYSGIESLKNGTYTFGLMF